VICDQLFEFKPLTLSRRKGSPGLDRNGFTFRKLITAKTIPSRFEAGDLLALELAGYYSKHVLLDGFHYVHAVDYESFLSVRPIAVG
jgi:hypothetical protein